MTVINDIGSLRCSRLFDVSIACVVIAASLPLMMIVALTIKIGGSGPVLGHRIRICHDGRWIQMLEFRVPAEHGWKTGWLYRFFRRTRIDALPQAINVLRGDLTFIGADRPAFLI